MFTPACTRYPVILATSLAAALLAAIPARASVLGWDSNGLFSDGITDGSGNWDTSTPDWNTGSANAAWNNANNDTAVFGDGGSGGSTPATVALATGITAGGLIFDSSSLVSTYTITGNTLTLAGPAPTITTNTNAAIASILAGTAGWIKAGPGTLTLSQTANISGTVAIDGGILDLATPNNGAGALGHASAIAINNSGEILISNDNSLTGSGASAPVAINSGGLLTTAAGVTAHVLGVLTIAGGELGSAVPSGNGTYYGIYDLDGGVIAGGVAGTSVISAQDVALSQGGGTVFTVNPGAANGIDLDVTGNFFHAEGDYDNGLIKAGNGVMRLSGGNTYTSPTTVNAGTLLISGSTTGSALTVNSGGAAIVTGTVSGGAALVNGGSLMVASGGTIAGPVTVSSGIFGGAGSASGAVTVNSGGTLAPGFNGPGFLSIGGNLSLSPGASLAVDLDGTTGTSQYSQLLVFNSGTIALGGNLQLALGYTPAMDDVFYLIINQGPSPVSGTFSNAIDQGNGTGLLTSGGDTFLVSYSANALAGGLAGFAPGSGQDVALEVVATVPEPGAAPCFLTGATALLGLLRFRRRPVQGV